ncbi:TRAP transporter small permease [Loktanella sp. DJP18]|uniref:TRAP transporter small permease n=1 Tax=Loktanella sp. DJP18 TaxID=3409788 RepID=UPI003BB6702C
MTRLTRFARGAVQTLAVLGVAAYGMAAFVTVADVIGRRFGYPIAGVVDLVQLFVVTGAWLVMPFAFMTAAHVSVDFLLTSLPAALMVPLRLLAMTLTLALVGMMLWQGFLTYQTRIMYGDTSQQLGIPIAWFWYPLLIGLAVSLVAVLLELASALLAANRHG